MNGWPAEAITARGWLDWAAFGRGFYGYQAWWTGDDGTFTARGILAGGHFIDPSAAGDYL